MNQVSQAPRTEAVGPDVTARPVNKWGIYVLRFVDCLRSVNELEVRMRTLLWRLVVVGVVLAVAAGW